MILRCSYILLIEIVIVMTLAVLPKSLQDFSSCDMIDWFTFVRVVFLQCLQCLQCLCFTVIFFVRLSFDREFVCLWHCRQKVRVCQKPKCWQAQWFDKWCFNPYNSFPVLKGSLQDYKQRIARLRLRSDSYWTMNESTKLLLLLCYNWKH